MGAKVRHNRDNRRQPEASTWNLPSNGINQIHNSPVPVAASQAERPGCNFGVVAFASQWIILDTDIKPDPTRPEQTAEQARAKARAMRAELFKSWGMNPTRYRMFNPPAAAGTTISRSHIISMRARCANCSHRPLEILSALCWENHSSKHDLIGPTRLLPR
jgi:hypothetical protein